MENKSNRPVQTFREGAIGASVWKREGKNGPFYEFTLSRSYKRSEEEAGYSQCFREENQAALTIVIADASLYIRALNTENVDEAA